MDHVYAECPWVVPPDAPELLTHFREKGRPAFVRSRTVVNFGEEPTAYMVEEGLVGTFAGGVGKYERLIVLLSSGNFSGSGEVVIKVARDQASDRPGLSPHEGPRDGCGAVYAGAGALIPFSASRL